VGHRGMGSRTLLIGLLLGLLEHSLREWLIFFPNCNVTLSWTEVFPEVYSLSYPDLKMAEINVYIVSLKGASWEMSLLLQSSRFCYLRKDAI